MRTTKIAVLLVLLTLLLGCPPGQTPVTTTLQTVLVTASAVLPLIPGIPEAVQVQVRGYLAAVSAGIARSTDILASTVTPTAKAAGIVAAFAGIAKPSLPPGPAQQIAGAIDAVADAIAKFLATAVPPTGRAVGPQAELSKGDVKALVTIRAEAHKLYQTVQRP